MSVRTIARHVIDTYFNTRLLSRMASYYDLFQHLPGIL